MEAVKSIDSLTWSDESYTLQDVLEKFGLPNLVRVQEACYDLDDDSTVGENQMLMLHALHTEHNLVAEDFTGRPLSLPLQCEGSVLLCPLPTYCRHDSIYVSQMSSAYPTIKYFRVMENSQNERLDCLKPESILEIERMDSESCSVKFKDVDQPLTKNCNVIFEPLLDYLEYTLGRAVQLSGLPATVRFMPRRKTNQRLDNKNENFVSNLGKVTVLHSEEPTAVIVATTIGAYTLGMYETSTSVKVKCCQIPRDCLKVTVPEALLQNDASYLRNVRKLSQAFLHKFDITDLDRSEKCRYLDCGNTKRMFSSVLWAKVRRPKTPPKVAPRNRRSEVPPATFPRRHDSHDVPGFDLKPAENLERAVSCMPPNSKARCTVMQLKGSDYCGDKRKLSYAKDDPVYEHIDDDEYEEPGDYIEVDDYGDVTTHDYVDMTSHDQVDMVSDEYIDMTSDDYIDMTSHNYVTLAPHDNVETTSDDYIDMTSDDYIDMTSEEYTCMRPLKNLGHAMDCSPFKEKERTRKPWFKSRTNNLGKRNLVKNSEYISNMLPETKTAEPVMNNFFKFSESANICIHSPDNDRSDDGADLEACAESWTKNRIETVNADSDQILKLASNRNLMEFAKVVTDPKHLHRADLTKTGKEDSYAKAFLKDSDPIESISAKLKHVREGEAGSKTLGDFPMPPNDLSVSNNASQSQNVTIPKNLQSSVNLKPGTDNKQKTYRPRPDIDSPTGATKFEVDNQIRQNVDTAGWNQDYSNFIRLEYLDLAIGKVIFKTKAIFPIVKTDCPIPYEKNDAADIIPMDLSSLSVEGISSLLMSLNMASYVRKFQEEQIDGEILMDLDEAMLKSLGLKAFHVKKLIKVISGWRPNIASNNVQGVRTERKKAFLRLIHDS